MSMMHSYNSTPTKDNEDDEDGRNLQMFGVKPKPYHHFEQAYSASQIHFYLSKEIGEPSEYIDMIHRINVATPADVIYIHLNTPGGQMDTGVQLINAMQNSPAKIVTVLESLAYSLGTLIFLAGDEMVVNDNCMIMFHNFKGGVVGKGNELTSQLEATVKWFSTLAKKIYIPFMTEEEFARITRGEDLWMQSPEIRKRLDRMMKILQEEQDQPKKTRAKRAKTTEDSATVA